MEVIFTERFLAMMFGFPQMGFKNIQVRILKCFVSSCSFPTVFSVHIAILCVRENWLAGFGLISSIPTSQDVWNMSHFHFVVRLRCICFLCICALFCRLRCDVSSTLPTFPFNKSFENRLPLWVLHRDTYLSFVSKKKPALFLGDYFICSTNPIIRIHRNITIKWCHDI